MTGLAVSIARTMGPFSLDVSWEIGNELGVLFGYSGSGKSLTLRAIAGLLRPERGEIALAGRRLYGAGVDLAPRMRSVGYLFQDLALFPHMTVEENIRAGGQGIGREELRERCCSLVRRFRLSGLEKRRPADLSGGQRQRVAFARALIREPDALLLDEPFSALDGPLRAAMGDLLREVQRELRVPVVLVTHDREEALALGDRVIVYAGGRVCQAGLPEDVFSDPATEEVADLVRPARTGKRCSAGALPEPLPAPG